MTTLAGQGSWTMTLDCVACWPQQTYWAGAVREPATGEPFRCELCGAALRERPAGEAALDWLPGGAMADER